MEFRSVLYYCVLSSCPAFDASVPSSFSVETDFLRYIPVFNCEAFYDDRKFLLRI